MKRLICCLVFVWVALAAVVTASADAVQDMDPAYGPVMDLYRAGLAGREDVIWADSDDFNFSAWQCCLDWGIDPPASVGFALIDLDGNGSPELVIADATEDQKLEGIVFDVWAVSDGEAVLIRRGWERWRLYLTAPDEEGRYGFYQEGSSGASNSVFDQGRFRNGEAVTEHTLEYDGESAVLWQMDENAVSEEEANAALDTWTADLIRVDVIPFSD